MTGTLPLPDPASSDTRALYRAMWLAAEGVRVRLVVSFSLLVGSQLVKLAVPWLAAQAIDALQHAADGSRGGVASALPWVVGIFGAFAVSWALHGPGRVLERSVAVHVRNAVTDRLYARLARAPLAWHDRNHPADLQQRLAQSSRALSDFTQTQFIVLQSAVNLVGPLIALALLSPMAGGLAVVAFGSLALLLAAFDRVLVRLAHAENAAERRYGAVLLDCLANISTVLSLGLGPATRRTLARRLEDINAPLGRSIVVTEWKWCAIDLLTVVIVWSLVVVFAWQVSGTGGVLLGSLFMVYQYAQQAGAVVGSIAANAQAFSRMRTDFAAGDLLRAAPSRGGRTRRTDAATGTGAAARGPRWQRIEIRDLHFRHAGVPGEAARGGVQGAALELHRGERIALVGPSGSGKSTLLRLLAGLYEPTRGHIAIDGVVPLGVRTLADRATLIPQEAQVFEGTVRENLAFDRAYTPEAIASAARASGLDAVLADLPGGLDAPVAPAGANFSGGQRQRLCLARGILAATGRSVLLLDEPTSALDPLSESLVLGGLKEAFPDATLVASVHRMSLLAHFDRVVLMVAGTVVDSGTVDELTVRQPLFRELLRAGSGDDAPVERRAAS